MTPTEVTTDRRQFLSRAMRGVGLTAAGSCAGFFVGRRASGGELRWQIDPDKCIACSRCMSQCVLDESAVKCVQCFDMCGYCDICTGYFDTNYLEISTAAENQLCPTAAIERSFVEEKAGQGFFEYTINESLCIACGKCVKGCALMNGSLYLQVMHDRCVNCNECAIATACPTQALRRVPATSPYLLKRQARELMEKRAQRESDSATERFLRQVVEP